MPCRSVLLSAFLAGATSLALELTLVRMLAFFLATSLDFLAIPLALLGLAVGSMATHLWWRGSPESLAQGAASALLPVTAVSLGVFFFAFNQWFPEVHAGDIQPVRDLTWLLVASGTLLGPFVVFGAFFASLFASHPDHVGRLYAFDLAGAATGCVAAPVVLTHWGLRATLVVVLVGAFLLGQVGHRRRAARLASGGLLATVIVGVASGLLYVEHPDVTVLARSVTDSVDTPVVGGSVRWNALARSAVVRVGTAPEKQLFVVQDNGLSNVRLYPYREGREVEPGAFREHGLAWRMGRDPKRMLVLFAGAGRDLILLDAFARGHGDLVGIELNPTVLELALQPGIAGLGLRSFLSRKGVALRVQEGRDFLNQDRGTYDLVHVSNNGAVFANRTGHTRKFLDTREAMEAYLDRLAPDGMIVFANQPIGEKVRSYMDLLPAHSLDPRAAMFAYGWPDVPELHTLVVAPAGLSAQEVDRLSGEVARIRDGKEVLYAPGIPGADAHLEAIEAGFGEHRMVTDDRPFPRSLQLDRLKVIPSTENLQDLAWLSSWVKVFTVLVFGGVSALVAAVALLAGGVKARVPLWTTLYLVLTGVGYMCVEIGLIARTELVIGNPLYAVAINLSVFLVFNAVGSALQDRFGARTTPIVLAAAAVVGVSWGLGATALLARLALSFPLVVKAVLVAIAVAPPGVALGLFYPFVVGALVRSGRSTVIPATYGLTTLSSVLGSTLASSLLIEIGFSRVIVLGAVAYLTACVVVVGRASRG